MFDARIGLTRRGLAVWDDGSTQWLRGHLRWCRETQAAMCETSGLEVIEKC